MKLNKIDSQLDNAPALDTQIQLLKTLTHPIRLAILSILREGEHCVCHMETILGQRQAYISQQLAKLREAGLVQDRRDGWNIYYRVVDDAIFDVLDATQKFCGVEPMRYPKKVQNCTCPHCCENK